MHASPSQLFLNDLVLMSYDRDGLTYVMHLLWDNIGPLWSILAPLVLHSMELQFTTIDCFLGRLLSCCCVLQRYLSICAGTLPHTRISGRHLPYGYRVSDAATYNGQ